MQFTKVLAFTGCLSRVAWRLAWTAAVVPDNVFVERLWRTVKYEEVYLRDYENAWQAETSLREYFGVLLLRPLAPRARQSHAGRSVRSRSDRRSAVDGDTYKTCPAGDVGVCDAGPQMTRGRPAPSSSSTSAAAPAGAAKAKEKTTQTTPLTFYRYSLFSGTKNGIHFSRKVRRRRCRGHSCVAIGRRLDRNRRSGLLSAQRRWPLGRHLHKAAYPERGDEVTARANWRMRFEGHDTIGLRRLPDLG